MTKTYTITLDENVVESAKKLFRGEKLSPLLNQLLKEWNKKQEEQDG